MQAIIGFSPRCVFTINTDRSNDNIVMVSIDENNNYGVVLQKSSDAETFSLEIFSFVRILEETLLTLRTRADYQAKV